MTATFKDIATNGKLLRRFTGETVKMLGRMATRLHINAVMTVFHAAEFGECSNLNAFYDALSVNDQTTLKKWVNSNFKVEHEGEETTWLDFTSKKNKAGEMIGWRVKPGMEALRKGVYDFDELMELDSFRLINLNDPKVWDVNAFLEMAIKMADTMEKRSEKENVTLPPAFVEAVKEAKRQAIINHVDEAEAVKMKEAAANTNDTNEAGQRLLMAPAG